MKKLMSLGGNYFQMTVVKAAKQLGYHVIDVDYLPNNPAHCYADEYYNISTLNKEAVLSLAMEKQIDGIISYASDVSAPTAAYVAEQMELPTNPYQSVYLMTRKDLFHPFLKENGFIVPQVAQVKCVQEIERFFDLVNGPVILKPVNSSGSKGISKIVKKSQIKVAMEEAKKYSRDTKLVVEEFIERKNYQIAGDAFIVDGKIAYFGLANEHFDQECNPLVPIGESFPADISSEKREKAKNEIQKAVDLLGLRNGAINLDFIFNKNDDIFIIELGPRNGGNLITDAIKLASGVDLAEYSVKAALGEDISDLRDIEGNKFVSSYIYHVLQDMTYQDIRFSNELKDKIRLSDMFVKRGEKIHSFTNGSFGIGAALFEFESMKEMLYMMDHMNLYYQVNAIKAYEGK